MTVNIPIITTLNDSGIKKAEKAFGALSKKLTGALSVVAIERFASSAIKAFAAEEKAEAYQEANEFCKKTLAPIIKRRVSPKMFKRF